jgi:hypothetical protein
LPPQTTPVGPHAEIDHEARPAIFLPLDVESLDGIRRNSPEINKRGRIPHVHGKPAIDHRREEPALDLST